MQVAYYDMKYVGPRMEVDNEKRMIFADVEVTRQGKIVDPIYPAKFIYKTGADQPSTEVAKHMTIRDDLYVIVGMVNPTTKVASPSFGARICPSTVSPVRRPKRRT